MFLNTLLLIIGFILLIKGADIFIDGASNTAQNFKISKMLIGLTIVAFGTSAPELAVSISAIASGSTDLTLGNVIGSCALNILLILGIAAIIRPIKIKKDTIQREMPLSLLIVTLLAVLFLDTQLGNGSQDQFSRADAIVVLLFFTVFLYYLVSLAKRNKENKVNKNEAPKLKLGKSLVYVAAGMAGIIIGSEMVVQNSVALASAIGWSERLIALTVIAFGTSLPELVTTIVASRKDEQDMLVGNIIGSNIFNICIVLGIPVAIFGSITPASFQMLDLVMMVASAFVLFIFAATHKRISRAEGVIMVLAFAAYYTAIIMMG